MPPKIFGASPKFWGTKNVKFWTTFSETSALDTTYLWNKTSHRPQISKCQCSMCLRKIDLLSVTFDPETAEIRWLIVTYPMKIQHFLSLPGFPHIGHLTQANQILPDIRGLKRLTAVKKFGKIRLPRKFAPSLS